MAVDVDNARLHPFARRFDHRRAFGHREIGPADGIYPAVRQPHRAAIDPSTLAIIDDRAADHGHARWPRSEEHTSELQSLMRTSYAVFCLKKKKRKNTEQTSLINSNTQVTQPKPD